ncbi:hypothetical protein ADL12_13010 [Streptomyces regalis]|uniref:Uncharacterized protein n=2 Tax=Streptomyces regalis TaxID=68262 RepID=A0A0X3V8E2_9ACTN|nr:hypothetical protein ADL12_13010 [Streptomyces regalis]
MMSADRETNHGMTSHDMTNTDIAFLLADAADEVEIGIAPYDAVLRGGRRRRARRWALATATALALVGSAGTLAMAGLPGGDGSRGSHMATQPSSAEDRHVYVPQRSTIATGNDHGKEWWITIDVWGAPRDAAEAQAQWAAMATYGDRPVGKPSELIGRKAFFVARTYGAGAEPQITMLDVFTHGDSNMSGSDIETASLPLDPGSEGPNRLVIGQVGKTARTVTCTWKDGTMTDVRRVPAGYDINTDDQVIRPVDGSPVNWFVCVAPDDTVAKEAYVSE